MAKKKKKDKSEEINLAAFEKVKSTAQEYESTRDTALSERFDELCDMYFMDWKEETGDKKTVSPAARNKLQGMVRLLTSTVPSFNLPADENDPTVKENNEKFEKAANALWGRSNSVQEARVEVDMAHCGGLFDEIHVRVISTADMLAVVKKANEAAKEEEDYDAVYWGEAIKDAEQTAARVPFLYEALSPQVSYPVWTRKGIAAHFTITEKTVLDVVEEFPNAPTILAGKQDYDLVTVIDWWDKTYRYAWVKEHGDIPLIAAPHGLGLIPVVAIRVEGKRIHSKLERQNEPFLLTLLNTGMWPMQNAMLTAFRKNISALINAGFIHKRAHKEEELEIIHHEVIGNVIGIDGSLTPMGKDIIPADAMTLWGLVDGTIEESTIYSQALGEKLSGNTPYALNALLSQAGRLPLVPLKEGMQIVAKKLIEISFRWMKKEKIAWEDFGVSGAELPDFLEWSVIVEPDLPQDKLQAAQVAQSISSGEDPLASRRWVRENILNMGQSNAMQEEIWTEMAEKAAYGMGAPEMMKILMARLFPPPPPPPDQRDPTINQGESVVNPETPIDGAPQRPLQTPPSEQVGELNATQPGPR